VSERRRLDREFRDVTESPGLWDESDWRAADTAPWGVVVWTMVDQVDGSVSVPRKLVRFGPHWYEPEEWYVQGKSTRVSDAPTHWRLAAADEEGGGS